MTRNRKIFLSSAVLVIVFGLIITSMRTASADVNADLSWAQSKYNAACAALAPGQPTLPTAQRTRLLNDVSDARVEIRGLGGTMPPATCTTASPSPSSTSSPTGSPTSTPSNSPTSSPTPSATTTSPTPTPTNTGTVTHGSQINLTNTGYLNYIGPNGERCTDATLTTYANKMDATALGSNVFCIWLKRGINVNAPITITASRIDTEVLTPNGSGHHLTINWSTINTTVAEDFAIGDHDFDVYRSQLMGSSDGVRFDNTNLIEDYIRVKQASSADHNDGIQAYQADAGGSIIRCNIDTKPINASNGVYGNGAIFLADNSKGTTVIQDNLLAGGGYTLRLHESMHYMVTGNIVQQGSWLYGPLTTTAAIPGAFLSWSNNTTSGGTVLNP